MAPTLVNSYLTTGTAAGTLTSTAFTPSNGEVLVVKGVSGDSSQPFGTPSGGSQAYTLRTSATTALFTATYIWTAVVSGSPGSMSVAVTSTGSGNWQSMIVERWSTAALATTPAVSSPTTAAGPAAPSATITTTAANSVVSWCDGDWSASAPASRAYRSSATEDGIHDGSTTNYVAYYAYQAAAAAGSQTIGLTAPSTQKWSMVAIEILASGAAAATAAPVLWMTAIGRAANF